MELTTEQKARVFAQYQFTAVDGYLFSTQGGKQCYPIRYVVEDKDKVDETYRGSSDPEINFWRLILRPLSAITDDDAIQVARIIDVTYSADPNSEAFFDYDSLMCYVIELFMKGSDIREISADKVVEAFQFLIQRGYAVPFFISPGHPDNGKTPIELGLAIPIE